jgi:DNA polymerase
MVEIRCYADTETKSECDLKAHSTHRYAEHPTTDIQLFSYAFDEGEVKIWDRECGEPMPSDLKVAFRNKDVVFWFHNAWFDRNIIEHVLKIKLPLERYRCSMAAALSHGLPGGLDALGPVLGADKDLWKIKDGKRLVRKFCKPCKNKRTGKLKWATPLTDPEDWEKYKEYCRTDVIAMREIIRKIPQWNYPANPTELQLWYSDQTTNSRGMNIDLELADAAMAAIASAKTDLAATTKAMTQGEVEAASQRDAMIKHIASMYGYFLPDMRKASLQRIVEADDTPDGLRELLLVRLSTCTTSTSKYKRLVNATGADGRLRGTIQFSGASRTQRDGGRVFQPQNLARPVLKHKNILQGIEALIGGYAEVIGYDIMKLSSSALRYAICAPKGKKLVVADLAGIENRALAWLAGEEWKLQMFRDFDNDPNPDRKARIDNYKAAYSKAFKIDPKTVDDGQRFIGKILELSMGFTGGVGAFMNMALVYNVDMDDLASKVLPSVPEHILKEADSFYDWQNSFDIAIAKKKANKANDGTAWEAHYEAKRTSFLKKETFRALESLKRMWRAEHPATVALWKSSQDAVIQAVKIPKKRFYFGNNCYAYRTGNWTRITLPSAHSLCYPGMRVRDDGQLVFMGVDQYTKKWQEIKTFGGKLTENITQAFSRDIFKQGQLNAERAGYKVVLPVHDELLCEIDDTDNYTVRGLCEQMTKVPPWATGLPMAAEGFEDYRYHK